MILLVRRNWWKFVTSFSVLVCLNNPNLARQKLWQRYLKLNMGFDQQSLYGMFFTVRFGVKLAFPSVSLSPEPEGLVCVSYLQYVNSGKAVLRHQNPNKQVSPTRHVWIKRTSFLQTIFLQMRIAEFQSVIERYTSGSQDRMSVFFSFFISFYGHSNTSYSLFNVHIKNTWQICRFKTKNTDVINHESLPAIFSARQRASGVGPGTGIGWRESFRIFSIEKGVDPMACTTENTNWADAVI